MLFCSSRLPWPHKALKVPFSFCCKIAMKRCFSLVGGSLVFCGSLLGLFFIKAYFRAWFLQFSVFAIRPTRNAQFSKCGPALFWLILQLCVSLQTYSIKMKHWNCQFSPPDFGKTISLTWIAKNQHGVNNFNAFSYFPKTVLLLPT